MGLSDEERVEKMHWSCYHINETAKEIRKCKPEMGIKDDVDSLMELTDQIWPAMVGMDSNGLHWIVGSSATAKIKGSDSLWGTAIVNHCYKDRNKNCIFSNIEEISEFNPLDNFLSIDGLLCQCRFNGKLYSLVYKLYACTENLTYALRRYNDDFARKYQTISDLVSKIQGECFTIFAKHQEFARAYLAGEIFQKLFANEFFKERAMEEHWYHNLSLIMNDNDIEFTQVMDWHRVLHKENKFKDQDYILIGLEIMGRKYHYDHQFKKVEEAFKKMGLEIPKRLVRQFKKNQKAHEENEKSSRDQYAENSEFDHMFAIHGFDHDKPEKEIIAERKNRQAEYEEAKNRRENDV